ncbi:MAG: DM13 domain-containing protein [Coxiellaceae bacterium]|nr:DM13 domain-containing protein [Coxiellaceae bacterium]
MKTFFTAVISLIVGFIIGAAVMLIMYPYWFPPAQVNEIVQDASNKTIIARGEFIHPNPSDPVHWGKGNTSIYQQAGQTEVFLAKNFAVGPGPAFHIYLSQASDIKTNDDFKKATNYDLGGLKSFKGSQVYQVPSNVDMSKVKSVVVWCVRFSQLITSANLQPADAASDG